MVIMKYALEGAKSRRGLPAGTLNGFDLQGVEVFSRISFVGRAGQSDNPGVWKSHPAERQFHGMDRSAILQKLNDILENYLDIDKVLLQIAKRKFPKQRLMKFAIPSIPNGYGNIRRVGGEEFS